MSQHKCATDNLLKFKMDRCKLVDNPIEIGTKLSKDGVGTIVNSNMYKQLARSNDVSNYY